MIDPAAVSYTHLESQQGNPHEAGKDGSIKACVINGCSYSKSAVVQRAHSDKLFLLLQIIIYPGAV